VWQRLKKSHSIFWTTRILFVGLFTAAWTCQLGLLAAWFGTQQPPAPEFAYMSDRDGDWDIYAMDVNSRIDFRMTVDLPTTDSAFMIIDDRYPTWSPDGTQIAYHSNVDFNWDIYLMDGNGENVRQLTNDPSDDAMPVWSPDGTRIAFHSLRGGNWDIYVITLATGDIQRVTFYSGEDTFASWSPDGTQMVYVSDRDGDQEIYVRSALGDTPPEALDGFSLRQMTDNPYDDWSPTWSPDGRYIAYVSEDTSGYGIVVMDAQAGTLDPTARTITIDGGFMTGEWNPAWIQTANGLSLMFVSSLGGSDNIYMIDFSTACIADNELELANNRTCSYSTADRITRSMTNELGFGSHWAPDWRPLP
jgi:dipeptidyl aminopeptidase/acylaminoacyl peptidase